MPKCGKTWRRENALQKWRNFTQLYFVAHFVKRHLLTSFEAQEAQIFYYFFTKKYLIMDWTIYTCDCLNIYLTTLELEELDDFKKKFTHILFSTKDQKDKWVWSMIRKYHNHTLQTKTRPDIVIHFYKTRRSISFWTQIVCAKMHVRFSIFQVVPNVVVQHVNCFVVCCIKTTRYKRKGPSYLRMMWHTMLVSVYAISAIHRT